MTRVVFVKAFFEQLKDRGMLVHVPTGQTKKNWRGREVPEMKAQWQAQSSGRYSNTHVDALRLAQDMASAANALEQDGFDVIATESVLSGHHNRDCGYSVPQGILLIARKKSE